MSISNKRMVIKIGTSSLLKLGLNKFVEQLIKIKKDNNDLVIVTSGATGYGKKVIKNRQNVLGQKELAAVGQGILFAEYVKYFSQHNINIAQILVTQKVQENVLCNLLKSGIVPIINGNDPDCSEDLMYDDNDSLAGEVAMKIKADKVIILTDVDGVYDNNPRKNKQAKKNDILHNIPNKLLNNSKETGSSSGTGGMYTKLKMAQKLLSNNIDTYITSFLIREERNIKKCNYKKRKINGTLITRKE
jgi:glutamate 5-kinase